MIVEMRKLSLVAMSYDRDAILDALQKTNAVEITSHAETEDASPLKGEGEELRSYLSSLEAALGLLTAETELYAQEKKLKAEIPKDGFEVSYSQFMNAGSRKEEIDALVENVNRLADERNELKGELSRLERTLGAAEIYGELTLPFCAFSDTAHVRVFLGTVPNSAWEELAPQLGGLSSFNILTKRTDEELVCIVCHQSAGEETQSLLSGAGFTPCQFTGEETGEALVRRLDGERERLLREIGARQKALAECGKQIGALKLYCDYVAYQLEKAELSEKMRGTERTFLLQAYVPSGSEEDVKYALSSVSGAVYFEFNDVSEDETPPTLCRNNPVVENFETITDMYSSPSYREFDPNPIMSIFYSVFLGFILADVAYGILMILAGGLIWWKKRGRKSGMGSLAGVFAVGGIFAVIWGFLFNSFFGMEMPIPTVIPDAQSDMWTFVGISIPSVLILALLIGIVQLFAGYVCRMVQCWRWGRLWDGVWDGGVWAAFSIGVEMAVIGLVEEFDLSYLTTAGALVAAVSLVLAMVMAGRKEKFFGKFTKGFGALYGIINYVSDILSYARLYGLMLSGAVIAQIVSQYAVQFITTSVPLAIVGILLMLVGHGFNLAISLLGAYIHDARLQYVEFYGRFFVGDGEPFTPLGSVHKYVYVAPAGRRAAAVKEKRAAPEAA